VEAGNGYTCAVIKISNRLVCWGYDVDGQTQVPDEVQVLGGVVDVKLGNSHVVVILSGVNELSKDQNGSIDDLIK